ncbi:MAG: ATP-binding cassette domain-containing protein, partial [Nocardiopsaceae bacterium]|jgi:ABC-type sugar transport system ATPase subunit|nr:ATP-binding cassette domain-containing protein [Nocardiopsaceae bacterium]
MSVIEKAGSHHLRTNDKDIKNARTPHRLHHFARWLCGCRRLAGLVGAGRTEVAETVFGIRRPEAGSVRFDGRPLPAGDPAAAIARGVCMMTEDRKDSGLFLDMPIRANIAAPSLTRLRRGPLVNDRGSRDLALHYMRRLQIRAPSAETPVSRLSGGNQQKVLIAMWLATDPRVLIADEPTKGVDVGAKDEIHHILAALREEGAGVLLISSDPRETRRLADRVLVMRKGRIVAELPGDVTEGEIVAYASGASGGTAA